jgi:predicted nucleic acid-binding protein
VLYPSTLRDLLIRIAQSGMVQAKWTDQILDEVFTSLANRRPDLDPDRLARTRALMCHAVRDCLVVDYEDLVPALELPDPDDRHVLAAAIRSGAPTIVTNNLRDFPPAALARDLGVGPDRFDRTVSRSAETVTARASSSLG